MSHSEMTIDMDDPSAVHVAATMMVAMKNLQRDWRGKELPGTPSVNDYARVVVDKLRRVYEP